MDPIERIQTAVARTGKIIAAVKEDDLSKPTPCSEFDVRALLNHLIGGLEMLRQAAAGEKAAAPDGDQFDADPAKEYEARSAKLMDVLREPGVLDRTWEMPFAPLPGQIMASIAFVEHVTHGWDLAKATGQDRTIPDDLMAEARGIVERSDAMWRMPGVCGPKVEAPTGASESDKFAAFMGRQP